MTMMAMARQVMTKTLMATDVDNDDEEGNKGSLTTCNEGDNRYCDDGKGMDACGSCATKGDARWRHATTGNATTIRRTRDKREERRQQTRGDGGRGCMFKGGGRVKRMRGGGINTTTSR